VKVPRAGWASEDQSPRMFPSKNIKSIN
jgi:hypothetical protein